MTKIFSDERLVGYEIALFRISRILNIWTRWDVARESYCTGPGATCTIDRVLGDKKSVSIGTGRSVLSFVCLSA